MAARITLCAMGLELYRSFNKTVQMTFNYKPYAAVFVIYNIALLICFRVGIAPLQLGPFVGPLYLPGEGCVWLYMCLVSIIAFVIASVTMKHLKISVFVFALGLAIWYGTGAIFLMLLG